MSAINKAFTDIKLRPGVEICYRSHYLRANEKSSTKPEVHNVSQTDANAARGGLSHGHRGYAQKMLGKIGPAVRETCSRTDRHTDRLIATLHSPLLGRSN